MLVARQYRFIPKGNYPHPLQTKCPWTPWAWAHPPNEWVSFQAHHLLWLSCKLRASTWALPFPPASPPSWSLGFHSSGWHINGLVKGTLHLPLEILIHRGQLFDTFIGILKLVPSFPTTNSTLAKRASIPDSTSLELPFLAFPKVLWSWVELTTSDPIAIASQKLGRTMLWYHLSWLENLSHKLCDLRLENTFFVCLSQPSSCLLKKTTQERTKNTREYKRMLERLLLLKNSDDLQMKGNTFLHRESSLTWTTKI